MRPEPNGRLFCFQPPASLLPIFNQPQTHRPLHGDVEHCNERPAAAAQHAHLCHQPIRPGHHPHPSPSASTPVDTPAGPAGVVSVADVARDDSGATRRQGAHRVCARQHGKDCSQLAGQQEASRSEGAATLLCCPMIPSVLKKTDFTKNRLTATIFNVSAKKQQTLDEEECKSSPRSSVPALREQDEDEEDVVSCAVG